ncbi:MAG TPA: ATP-binding protein [Pseudolabrys sp.]|nr:ATP-binding protein [Pseudolabrys sp.]
MTATDQKGWLARLQAAWTAAWQALGGIDMEVERSRLPATLPQAPLLENLIAVLPVPTILIDRNETVRAFNLAAIDIAPVLQQGQPMLIGLRVPELIDAVRRAGATRQSQRVEFEQRVPHPRYFEAFINPVSLPADPADGRVDYLLIAFNDLTPLRRVEEMRADFVANASHELRTPLAALLGFIETLQGSARDDAPMREKFLGIMREQAARMARLIDDLLSLSRIELNVHVRPSAEVDLVGVVRQVADGLQMLARDRDVTVHISADEPITIAGERDELVRAFENLVENALKYGSEGKRVDLGVRRVQTKSGVPEAEVSVRDYGPGIPAQHLPRLTERFYRVNATTSRAQGGTGLGLALVKHILHRHGGRLTIDSREGSGATFTAYLPIHSPRSAKVKNI